MKTIKTGMLNKHEDVDYLYVFHDLASHKVDTDVHYSISKTYYFVSDEEFYNQDEMLQDSLDAEDFQDESVCLDYVAKLNKQQLKTVQKSRRKLFTIQKSAPTSSSILDLIEFHEEVIGVLLKWFNKKNISILPKKRSGGRPKGSHNKNTIKKYIWIRDMYYFLKDKRKAHTVDEFARLIRSQLKNKPPTWWRKPIYKLETVRDIIIKQKWGD